VVLRNKGNLQGKVISLPLVLRAVAELEETNQPRNGGLLNYELCDLHFSVGTVKVVRLSRLPLAFNVGITSNMRKERNTYRTLVVKLVIREPLVRPKRKLDSYLN
jgi:hypothetical protein